MAPPFRQNLRNTSADLKVSYQSNPAAANKIVIALER